MALNTYYCLATAFDWDSGTIQSEITQIQAEKKPANTRNFKDGLYPWDNGAMTLEKKFYATQANAEKGLKRAVEKAKRDAKFSALHYAPQRPKPQAKIIDIAPFLRKKECLQ